jgi:hypothetical protein
MGTSTGARYQTVVESTVGGWYGLRKGYRGRFAAYVGATLETLGDVEFAKRGRSTWVRAI